MGTNFVCLLAVANSHTQNPEDVSIRSPISTVLTYLGTSTSPVSVNNSTDFKEIPSFLTHSPITSFLPFTKCIYLGIPYSARLGLVYCNNDNMDCTSYVPNAP